MKTIWPAVTLRTVALTTMALAVGCSGTLHSRWVRDDDTTTLWSSRMNDLPIRLHQPNSEVVLHDMRATPSERVEETDGLLVMPRMELYVGGTGRPTNDSVCSAAPKLKPDPVTNAGVLVVAVLCDGARLVVTAEDHLKSEEASPSVLLYRKMQHQLLHAIDISVAQRPVQQYG